jgi:hypothetical protein
MEGMTTDHAIIDAHSTGDIVIFILLGALAIVTAVVVAKGLIRGIAKAAAEGVAAVRQPNTPPTRLATPRRVAMIECASCLKLLDADAQTCMCGWKVPRSARM